MLIISTVALLNVRSCSPLGPRLVKVAYFQLVLFLNAKINLSSATDPTLYYYLFPAVPELYRLPNHSTKRCIHVLAGNSLKPCPPFSKI